NDLGDADAAADLDQLAPGYRDAATPGQAHRNRERGSVVVRDQSYRGAGEGNHVVLDGGKALAAPPGLGIELELRGNGGRGSGGLDRRPPPGGTGPVVV